MFAAVGCRYAVTCLFCKIYLLQIATSWVRSSIIAIQNTIGLLIGQHEAKITDGGTSHGKKTIHIARLVALDTDALALDTFDRNRPALTCPRCLVPLNCPSDVYAA